MSIGYHPLGNTGIVFYKQMRGLKMAERSILQCLLCILTAKILWHFANNAISAIIAVL